MPALPVDYVVATMRSIYVDALAESEREEGDLENDFIAKYPEPLYCTVVQANGVVLPCGRRRCWSNHGWVLIILNALDGSERLRVAVVGCRHSNHGTLSAWFRMAQNHHVQAAPVSSSPLHPTILCTAIHVEPSNCEQRTAHVAYV